MRSPGKRIEGGGYDLKLQANLLKHAGIDLAGKWLDIALMHYLVDPEKSHAVDILSRSYLNIELDEMPADTGTGSLFDEVPEAGENVRSREAAALVLLGRKVRETFRDRLSKSAFRPGRRPDREIRRSSSPGMSSDYLR